MMTGTDRRNRDFHSACALVTGGGGAIGAATARRLADAGAAVAVVDRDGGAAQRVAEELGRSARVIGLAADVADPDSARGTVERVARALGGLNVVVNNAGVLRDASLAAHSLADWDLVNDVNLRSGFLVTQAAEPYLVAHGWARVVNISSTAALGKANRVAYAAAKMGVQGLTKALALELGPAGVTVNAVAPGFVTSAMTDDAAAIAGRSAAEHRMVAAGATAVGRVGTPADIAEAVAYFASPHAGFVAGQVLYVDGGIRL